MFWSYRLTRDKGDARNIITERILIGSMFNKDRSYVTLDRIVISREMRVRVRSIKQRYNEI